MTVDRSSFHLGSMDELNHLYTSTGIDLFASTQLAREVGMICR